ncbi:MAG: hypothetical protein K2L82_06325 [Lachnospiraceae bacterium]|nr:hypothetical protein [Lachnospiraceae bacterium]
MDEFKATVQALKRIILSGGETVEEDWIVIIDQLVGLNDATTIQNIQDFVCENFSLKNYRYETNQTMKITGKNRLHR